MALELKFTDQKFWQISPYLAEYLSVKEGETVWLHVGAERCEVIVKIHNNYQGMSLNEKWAADLNLTPGKWKVRCIRDGIRLGPIIGIVCAELPSHPPAKSDWLRYLTAIDGGLGILLTPEGFDQEHRRVYGFTLSEDKQHWTEGEMPWPDALYVRTYPVNPPLQAFLQKEFPYRHFNTQTLLNKGLVFQLLSENQDIKLYLPETVILDSAPGKSQSIMQQALLMPENEYQSSDFRVIMQKKDDGIWHITGLEGTILKAQRMKEIYRLCLLVVLTLEEYFGQLGEIGLDLRIDREKHLWILGVNGMPAENFIKEFYSPFVAKNLYSAPMLYAAYLSGFSDVIYPLA